MTEKYTTIEVHLSGGGAKVVGNKPDVYKDARCIIRDGYLRVLQDTGEAESNGGVTVSREAAAYAPGCWQSWRIQEAE